METSEARQIDLHGLMRRKERAIEDRAEIDEILREGKVLHLALCLENRPFLVPLFYAYDGMALYFHSAQHGTKIEILKRNPHVCFEVSLHQGVIESEKACDFEARHRTVIGTGKAVFLDSELEKSQVLDRIVGRFSEKKFSYPSATLAHMAVIRIRIESLKGKKHGGLDEGLSL